jgi:hypothetical protein
VSLAATLIISLIAGYAFSLTWDGSRYFAVREDGYRLTFRAAFYGLVMFLYASLVHLALITQYDHYLDYYKRVLAAFTSPGIEISDNQITLLSLAIITLAIGVFLGHLLNNLPYSKKILLYIATFNDDFEQLVLRSVRKSMPVCVTMSNKKVYVGYAIRTIDPGEKRTFLRILPIMSGYRTATGLINFNVTYHNIYESIQSAGENDESAEDLSHLELGDFEKVLPYEEIQSCHLFDLVAYLSFLSAKEPDIVKAVFDDEFKDVHIFDEKTFDVFLSHNSNDKAAIKIIAQKLKEKGLKPWLDEEQIRPGTFFQDHIQKAISHSKAAAIFIGPGELGKFQLLEIRGLVSSLLDKEIPVIPVLLPNRDNIPDDLLFLNELNFVKFSNIDDTDALERLVWGICGK